MRLLNSGFISKLPWVLIGLFALLKLIHYFYESQFYPQFSQKTSPDGEKTIYEFNQLSDGKNHAPYGKLLSLSYNRNIRNPEAGYIFFAGYCNPLNYSWQGNEKILVVCHAKEKAPVRTLASSINGITVEFRIK